MVKAYGKERRPGGASRGGDRATVRPVIGRGSGILPFVSTEPSVVFVSVHNAGRSQMAAGFLRDLAGNSLAEVRVIRVDIEARVLALIRELDLPGR